MSEVVSLFEMLTITFKWERSTSISFAFEEICLGRELEVEHLRQKVALKVLKDHEFQSRYLFLIIASLAASAGQQWDAKINTVENFLKSPA